MFTMMKTAATVSAAAMLFGAAAPACADWDDGDPHKMHFPQLPDPEGWDVHAGIPNVLADDWVCSQSGPVTDFHLWGSWEQDRIGQILQFHLSVHDDGGGRPGALLWARDFFPGEWRERPYGQGQQGWHDPRTGFYNRPDHSLFFQYNFENFPDPFVQQQGQTYWLDVAVVTEGGLWGWKTSLQQFQSPAWWGDFPEAWRGPIVDPQGLGLDMAFVITPAPGAAGLLGLAALAGVRRRRSGN